MEPIEADFRRHCTLVKFDCCQSCMQCCKPWNHVHFEIDGIEPWRSSRTELVDIPPDKIDQAVNISQMPNLLVTDGTSFCINDNVTDVGDWKKEITEITVTSPI